MRHPSSYPIVEEILGKGAPRYSEFNFRETPPNRGRGNMGFHFDRTPSNAGTMDQRTKLDHLTEPPDYICTIHCELHTTTYPSVLSIVSCNSAPSADDRRWARSQT